MPRRRTTALAVALVGAVVAVLAAPPVAADAGGGRWLRVAFAQRIAGSDADALLAAGAAALQYAPHDTYLVFGDDDVAAAARALPAVAEVADVAPAAKVGAAAQEAASSGVGGAGLAVQVLAASAAADATAAHLDDLGTVLGRGDLRGDGAIALLTATVPAAGVAELARRAEVLHVDLAPTAAALEDEGSAQVLAGNVQGGQPMPGYRNFLDEVGVDGSGVTMSVVDDGIDATHPEFIGRIARRYSYSPLDRAVPSDGHGTHVAGILGGRGAAIGPLGVRRDGDGLAYGTGVAPGVTLVDQPALVVPVGRPHPAAAPVAPFPPADGFRALVGDALAGGAVGWNASWTDGGGAGRGYPANAASLDALARDGDAAAAGAQPFTFVFSAGNSGAGSQPNQTRITSPKEAKNLIVVASSRGHRAGPVENMSSFSSRGPARDGRIVPTVTAPGETIISARAASGVLCTVPASGTGDVAPADGLTLYTGCSGTSMASPHVAGAVALLTQWWRQRHDGADPSPAMARALLVNTAHDLGVDDVPNRNEGWGRVDLRALLAPPGPRLQHDQQVVLEDVDEVHAVDVAVADPAQPLRVTVAWTDPPGMVSEEDPVLVNDLDLVVVAPDGTRYLGNVFANGASVGDGQPDRLNNLENVWLPTPQAGTYRVEVRAANLPGDGVPGAGSVTDQDFALVVANAA